MDQFIDQRMKLLGGKAPSRKQVEQLKKQLEGKLMGLVSKYAPDGIALARKALPKTTKQLGLGKKGKGKMKDLHLNSIPKEVAHLMEKHGLNLDQAKSLAKEYFPKTTKQLGLGKKPKKAGKRKPNAHAQMVSRIMKQADVTLTEASKMAKKLLAEGRGGELVHSAGDVIPTAGKRKAGKRKPNAHAQMVSKIMKQADVTLAEASKMAKEYLRKQ